MSRSWRVERAWTGMSHVRRSPTDRRKTESTTGAHRIFSEKGQDTKLNTPADGVRTWMSLRAFAQP